MKKTLAVVLAVVMLLAALTICFAVFADEPTECPAGCGRPHVPASVAAKSCTCCLNCPNIDLSKVAGCAKDNNGVTGSKCCTNCTGFYNCTCGRNANCGCAFCSGAGVNPNEDEPKPLISEQGQLHIKELFQSIMHKISDVFDRIFEVAFAVFNVKGRA